MTKRTKRAKRPTGYVVHHMISGGEPIVLIFTVSKSQNTKTGDMIQGWIMLEDYAPGEAVRNGHDAAVCGSCPLRPIVVLAVKARGLTDAADGTIPCYVAADRAPAAIHAAYQRGMYPEITPEAMRRIIEEDGRSVRLGAYGDPGRIPFEIWQRMGVGAGTYDHTSYTHAWLQDDFDPRHLQISMVSIDPKSASSPLIPEGARSYRVLAPGESPKADEILCPHTTRGTQCADCGLCAGSGKRAKSIVVADANKRTLG